MSKDSSNPMAVESKRRLMNALLKLMEDKEFHKISIQELATKAGMDRRTFYRNFNSKEEILERHFNVLQNKYISRLMQYDELTLELCYEKLTELALEHKHFFILMDAHNLSYLMHDSFKELIEDFFVKINRNNEIPMSLLNRKELEYRFNFNMGGFWINLFNWLVSKDDISKEDFLKIVAKISY